MKTIIATIFVLVATSEILPQPLNGSYTIGGGNPDYITLQDAANALKANGVSGPVFFNIRPGTYSKNGGNNTVLILDSLVNGLSSSNRVSFQPDDAAGGNVANVILERNITNPSTADAKLVLVSLDYVTFQNITFRENDISQHVFFNRFVELKTSFYNSPLVEDIEFIGCRFIGTDPSSTETGLAFASQVKGITIRESTFLRLLVGVEGSGTQNENVVIENNQFLKGYYAVNGSGSPGGAAMQVYGQNIIIKKNIIDFSESTTGGYLGIYVNVLDGGQYVIIEENLFKGWVSQAIYLYGYGGAQADSSYIANNMIYVASVPVWANEPAYGLRVTASNVNIVFNTMVLVGYGTYGLSVHGNNCNVFNNIIINRVQSGSNITYDQGNSSQSLNLQTDYNDIYRTDGSSILVYSDGVYYYTFGDYINATELDTNSISQDIEFVAPDDLHLTECQSQDPNLRGIPIDGITIDIDGELRNETSPVMGADEYDARMNDMFGDPFVTALPGTAFSIDSAPFDNLLADGFAIPDYDNNQVRLYHYNGDRTYSHSGTIQTGNWPPTGVKFFDVDSDDHLDLIVGYEENWLQIYFGDGAGGFPTLANLESLGHVRSMEVGIDQYNQEPILYLTIDDAGFPPQRSFLAYVWNWEGTWEIRETRQPGSIYPDTIYAVMDDFAIGNLDSEPDLELFALTVGTLGEAYLFKDSIISGSIHPYAIHYRYILGNTSSYGTSSIEMADFDGDGDNDIVTTGYDKNDLVLLKNLGNFTFADEEIITRQTEGFVTMDYENDGDIDIVTMNRRLDTNGITVFLNDGFGNFTARENCYFPYANGVPWSIIASDFDRDGRTDIAITSTSDSLFVLYNLGGGTVGIQDEETEVIPDSYSLTQNFPNPFNPTTTIQFSIPVSGLVQLSIYNILGEEVKTLLNEEKSAGNHSVQFNASHLASGIYLYRIQAENFVQTKKMILLK